MLLKKSTIALCSSGSLSSTLSLPASIATSSNPSHSTAPSTIRPCRKQSTTLKQWQSSRSYATSRDDDRSRHGDSSFPAWPSSKNPTPYEIFNQTKGAPYSKKTFYQLVKLYHPDRHHHTSHHTSHHAISHAIKLERYRLVVAANDILCDPVKRRAYDLYGAGWAGQTDMQNIYREADRAWRREAGSAAHNATWEDWERWHENNRREKKGPDPVYMSNGLFVCTILIFVMTGGWVQKSRAGSHSSHLIEMREKNDNNISEDMWRRKQEKAYLTREDRVENFLKQREGWSSGAANDSHMPRN